MLAFASALAYAGAAALQESAVSDTGGDGVASPRLIMALLRRPRWLGGVASTLLGAILHVVALKLGPLAIVQPVGVAGLLFALPLGALLHARRPAARELVAAAGIAVGLAVLLASVRAASGKPDADRASHRRARWHNCARRRRPAAPGPFHLRHASRSAARSGRRRRVRRDVRAGPGGRARNLISRRRTGRARMDDPSAARICRRAATAVAGRLPGRKPRSGVADAYRRRPSGRDRRRSSAAG